MVLASIYRNKWHSYAKQKIEVKLVQSPNESEERDCSEQYYVT
jgi:hypothetical protein